MENDTKVKYYIDAKTTMTGIGNSDSIPFFMRTSQWEFLNNPDRRGKYYIARIFKKGNQFDIRFLQIDNATIKS